MRLESGLIEQFIALLRDSWQAIEKISSKDSFGSFKQDWLQASWELSVEGILKQRLGHSVYLEPYGDGADANGASSRILDPNALPTHSIYCLPKNSARTAVDQLSRTEVEFPESGLQCDRFVGLGNDGWYYERPPFDMVLVTSQDPERVFPINELEFLITKISSR